MDLAFARGWGRGDGEDAGSTMLKMYNIARGPKNRAIRPEKLGSTKTPLAMNRVASQKVRVSLKSIREQITRVVIEAPRVQLREVART